VLAPNADDVAIMDEPEGTAAVVGKRRTFKKFTFRGVDLDALLTLKPVDVLPLLTSRARRKINRGLTRKPLALIKKLNKAKKEAPEHEKPAAVKTHLRNMIIIPEMIGSIVGVYNGKVFTQVEIKPEVSFKEPFRISLHPSCG
jgi:small subunit ribosomal protein S15e